MDNKPIYVLGQHIILSTFSDPYNFLQIFSFLNFSHLYLFQFYWEITAIRHCTSFRCTTWWFDLYILWSDYCSRCSRLTSIFSHRYSKKRRKKNILMRTLRIYSLNFPSCHTAVLVAVITLYSISVGLICLTIGSYKWGYIRGCLDSLVRLIRDSWDWVLPSVVNGTMN